MRPRALLPFLILAAGCVTVDGDTLKDDVVTIRHRDSMVQEKLKVAEIETWLRGAIRGWKRPGT